MWGVYSTDIVSASLVGNIDGGQVRRRLSICMGSIGRRRKGNGGHCTRASAGVAVIVLLGILNLIVLSLTLNQAHEHDLTVRRLDTIKAFYAAEAGINMAVRELMIPADEDGDDDGAWPFGIGTISDDSDDGTDPTLGTAKFVVFAVEDTPLDGQTSLTSQGRSGLARRQMTTVIE